MIPRERAAYNAGIETVRQMAMIAAVSIEVRDGGGRVQNQSAVAALQELADAARLLIISGIQNADTLNPME